MVESLSTPARILSALVIAGAMAMTFLSPAEAQTAKKLKCKGCVKSKQIKNNAIKGKDIRDGSLTARDLSNETGGDFDVNETTDAESFVVGALTVYRTVNLTAPSAGQVILNASGYFVSGASAVGRCSISKTTAIDNRTVTLVAVGSLDSGWEAFGITWGETVSAGTQSWNLVCDPSSGTPTLVNPALTAIFVPTVY